MIKHFYCDLLKADVDFDTVAPPFDCFCIHCPNDNCKLRNTCANCECFCIFSVCKDD